MVKLILIFKNVIKTAALGRNSISMYLYEKKNVSRHERFDIKTWLRHELNS